jgi:hypothetical protein
MNVIVLANAGAVQDVEYNTVLSPSPNMSSNVTATGPAMLVALWAGDAGGDTFSAVPNNGFSVVLSFLDLAPTGGVGFENAEAVLTTNAGTYSVTWAESPTEGAHLWMVAVQAGQTNASVSPILVITNSGTGFVAITGYGSPRSTNLLQYTTALPPSSWSPLSGVTNDPSGAFGALDRIVSGQRFYRSVLP